MTLSTEQQTHLYPSSILLNVINTLPPLPTISSDQLLDQIFTHSSLRARPRHEFEAPQDDPVRDNEGWVHLPPPLLFD